MTSGAARYPPGTRYALYSFLWGYRSRGRFAVLCLLGESFFGCVLCVGGRELILVVTQRIRGHTLQTTHQHAHRHTTHSLGVGRGPHPPSNNVERLKQVCDNVVERTPLPLQLVIGEAVPPQHLFGRHPVLTDARVAVLEALQPSLAQTVVDLS